jgi:hypothetical protein
MTTSQKTILLAGVTLMAAGICAAQFRGGGRRGGGRGFGGGMPDGPFVRTEGGNAIVNEDTVRTARETPAHSTEPANWTNRPGFEKDVFTFARVIYKFNPGMRSSWMGWINDYPDSDLNLSYRIQQMTSLHTDPDGRTLKLTNPDLLDYPFIYAVKAGRLQLRDEEVPILRKYLLNGGVLMADDFWGDRDWESFEGEIKRVLPERSWIELRKDHPVFHNVFDIKAEMNKLQVPSMQRWERTRGINGDPAGLTYRGGEDTHDMHVRAWLDDKQRIMVIATHNTDNGDGWEREGEEHEYFQMFSEQRAYPLGINIIFYTMTH